MYGKKLYIIIAILICALFVCTATADSMFVQTTKRVNIRTEAKNNAENARLAEQGEVFEYTADDKSFYTILYDNGQTGYLPKNSCKITGAVPAENTNLGGNGYISIPLSIDTTEKWGTFEWGYSGDTIRIDGEGTIMDGGPWDKQLKKAKILEVGENIETIMIQPKVKNLTTIVFHGNTQPSYREIYGANKKLTEVYYTGKNPVFYGSMFSMNRLTKIVFTDPSADFILDDNMLMNKARTILYYYFDNGEKEVTVPETVEQIGDGAFANCKAKSVILPEKLTFIGEYAFAYCKQLKSITVPENVKRIASCAFMESGIETIDFLCPKIELYYSCEIGGHITYNMGYSIFAGTALKEITLPECNEITQWIFARCKSLKKIVFSEGTKTIGKVNMHGEFFKECKKLETIVLPDSITEIDYMAFQQLPKKCVVECHAGTTTEQLLIDYGIKYKTIE